jgi:transcriptional regulator with XRE-family HTH domain
MSSPVVPRQTPRAPGPDDWVADRIRYERQRLGWSTAELARRVTDAGCKISQSSVWSIESGEPRRKVSAGEAVAFAEVFSLSLDELIRPPDDAEILMADVARFHNDVLTLLDDADALERRLQDVARRYETLKAGPPDSRIQAIEEMLAETCP